MTTPSTLAKKTKAELIDEYQDLLQRFDEVKKGSKEAFSQPSLLAVQKAKTHTTENVVQAISQFKTNINQQLSDFSNTFHTHVNTILGDLLNEVKKFDDLQQAIEISKNMLETQHRITVAAETLEQIVLEAEDKRKKTELEHAEHAQALDAEMLGKRRAWEREQEEHEYDLALKKKRDQSAWEEEKNKREAELQCKENWFQDAKRSLEEQEGAVKTKLEDLDKEFAQKEKDAEKRCQLEYAAKLDLAKREWEAERKLLDVQMQGQQDEIKRLLAEGALLRKEMEVAQKKVQELAIRVIESGTPKLSVNESATHSSAV